MIKKKQKSFHFKKKCQVGHSTITFLSGENSVSKNDEMQRWSMIYS